MLTGGDEEVTEEQTELVQPVPAEVEDITTAETARQIMN